MPNTGELGAQMPQSQGTDTVPAMLTPGEMVMNRQATEMMGPQNLDRVNSLASAQHFAAGGLVQPYKYDPNPYGAGGGTSQTLQNWDKQLGGGEASGALPTGYNNYVQGFNPTTQQWEYNPNDGTKIVGGDTRGVATPGVGMPGGPSQYADNMPKAGDPNYYKYTSVGGAAYSMPKATPPAATPPPAGSTRGAGGTSGGGTDWTRTPPPKSPADVQDFRTGAGTSPGTGPTRYPTGGTPPPQKPADWPTTPDEYYAKYVVNGKDTGPGYDFYTPFISPDGSTLTRDQYKAKYPNVVTKEEGGKSWMWDAIAGRWVENQIATTQSNPGGSTSARNGGTGQSISQDVSSLTNPTRDVTLAPAEIAAQQAQLAQTQAGIAARNASLRIPIGGSVTPGNTPPANPPGTPPNPNFPGGFPGGGNPQDPSTWFDPRLTKEPTTYTAGDQFSNDLPPLSTRTSLQDVILSPAYQMQKAEQEKNTNRAYAARGRWNSSASLQALQKGNAELLANEYDRQDTQQYNRNLEINNLLYNRKLTADMTDWSRTMSLAQMALQATNPELATQIGTAMASMNESAAQNQAIVANSQGAVNASTAASNGNVVNSTYGGGYTQYYDTQAKWGGGSAGTTGPYSDVTGAPNWNQIQQ